MSAFRVLRAARRRVRGRSGQAILEFAFVVPLLILMIVALIDFGRAMLHFQLVTDSAREGARQAALANGPASDSIFSVVTSALEVGGIDVSSAVLDASDLCTPPTASPSVVTVYPCRWQSQTSGEEVRVGVAVPYQFTILGPFIGWATGQDVIILRSSIAMRNE